MLTRAQLDARAGKLTASRISALMTGDAEKVMRLYREMIGEQPEEDMSDVWPVQLGSVTEALNLDWYERNGNPLSRRGEVVSHPIFEWAAATLDGWDTILLCPIECKHVGGREPLEVVIDRYQPQMQWQMECTQAPQCALSVIMGTNEPVIEYIPFDHAYTTEMIRRGAQFMDFVRRREPPVALAPVPPPCDPTKIIDMTGNNGWAHAAGAWLDTKLSAERCKNSEKILKEYVPADAKKCFGHGVQITRDRANRLSLREQTK
jgi:hypothetical protein